MAVQIKTRGMTVGKSAGNFLGLVLLASVILLASGFLVGYLLFSVGSGSELTLFQAGGDFLTKSPGIFFVLLMAIIVSPVSFILLIAIAAIIAGMRPLIRALTKRRLSVS